MFTLDRETVSIAVVIVCIAATLYLYKELKQTKDEFAAAIAVNQRPVVYLNSSQSNTDTVKTGVLGEEDDEEVMVEAPAVAPPVPPSAPTKRKKAEKDSA
jgi:hypothetical protein